MSKTMWIVGTYQGIDSAGEPSWGFLGVFDTERAAESACESKYDFVGQIKVNQKRLKEQRNWIDTRYPLMPGEA